jgi:hypothetical protein
MGTTTAANLIDQLDPDEIVKRLDALDQERRALMVLLRATRSRQTRRGHSPNKSQAEGQADVA